MAEPTLASAERSLRARLPAACAVAAATLVAVAILYGGILPYAWTHDDPMIVRHVLSHHPADLLFSPSAWQEYNWRGFFPLQLVSFWLDARVFGLSVAGYRLHQLAALAVVALVLWAAGRRVAPPAVAAWGVAVFLLGPVTAGVAARLMTRNYIEGGALALGAILAFERAGASEKRRWGVLAALLYLAAVLAKEVYAPLPVVCALLARRHLRRRAFDLAALAVALGAALLYRGAMIEGIARSYRPDVLSVGGLASAAAVVSGNALRALLGGTAAWKTVGVGVVLVAVILAVVRERGAVPLLVGVALSVMAPLLFVAEHVEERHVFHVWLAVTLLLVWAFGSVLGRRPSVGARLLVGGVCLAVLAGLASANRGSWREARATARMYSALYDFSFVTGRDGEVLRPPDEALPQYFVGVRWLRRHYGDGAAGPEVVADDVGLCLVDLPATTPVFTFEGGRVVLAQGMLARTRAFCRSEERTARLDVEIEWRRSLLTWRLGPFGDGSYTALVMGTDPEREILVARFPLSRRGAAWTAPSARTLRVVIVYRSPDGWFAVTGPLTLVDEERTALGALACGAPRTRRPHRA